ncbi:hypothetical protein [Bacillus massiliglaciei]|uniref:hypothetical protein n=1 Tax=Bacillus massiliglaciei TaxID=1816693 RepID=UPI000AA29A56|nr:hypothetical protein [Bacillus massiliglaciei]
MLELVRIAAILFIGGLLLTELIKAFYASFGVDLDYTNGGLLIGIAVLLSLFVLYRNKLQFSGFYKGEGKVKLPRYVSFSLLCCSVLMVVIAPFMQ